MSDIQTLRAGPPALSGRTRPNTGQGRTVQALQLSHFSLRFRETVLASTKKLTHITKNRPVSADRLSPKRRPY